MILPLSGPGGGLDFQYLSRPFKLRLQVAEGDILQVDMGLTDVDVTNLLTGDPASGLVSVIAPTAAAIAGNEMTVFVQALEGGANDSVKECLIFGRTSGAFVLGNLTAGDQLAVSTNKNLEPVATGELIVARAAETINAVARSQAAVMFNGFAPYFNAVGA